MKTKHIKREQARGSIYGLAMMLGMAVLFAGGYMVTAGGGKSSKAKETVKIEFYREKTERKNPRSPLIEFVIQELSKEAIEALSNYLGQLLLLHSSSKCNTVLE